MLWLAANPPMHKPQRISQMVSLEKIKSAKPSALLSRWSWTWLLVYQSKLNLPEGRNVCVCPGQKSLSLMGARGLQTALSLEFLVGRSFQHVLRQPFWGETNASKTAISQGKTSAGKAAEHWLALPACSPGNGRGSACITLRDTSASLPNQAWGRAAQGMG